MPRISKTARSVNNQPPPDQPLEEPEFDLASIAESSTDSFLLFDESLNCVGINPAGQTLFGLSETDIVGKNVKDIIPSANDDPEEYKKYLNVIETGERLVTNSKLRKLFLGIKAFKVGDGLGITASDITERKMTEDSVSMEKEYWQSLFNSLHDVVLAIDTDYNVEAINDIGLELLGKSKEEVLGQKCYQVLQEADAPEESCPLKTVLKNKKAESFDAELLGRHYSVKLSPVLDDAGEVNGFIEYMTDITELKQVENEVKERCTQLEAKFEEQAALAASSAELMKRCAQLEIELVEQSNEAGNAAELKEKYAKLEAKLKEQETQTESLTELKERCTKLEAELKKQDIDEVGIKELKERCAQLEEKLKEQAAETESLSELEEQYSQLKEKFAEQATKEESSVEKTKQGEDERKRLEQELNMKDDTIALSLSGIALANSDGELTYVNQEFLKIWGYKRNDDVGVVLGKPVTELFANEEEAAEVLKILGEDGEWRGEMTGRKMDETEVEVEASLKTMSNEEGEISCTMLSFVDVTERNRFEKKLRIKDTAMALSFHPIVMTDLDGNLTFVNDSFLKMWEYGNEEDIIGKPFGELWYGEEKASDIMDALQEGGYWVGDLTAKRENGSTFEVELSASMVTDEEETPSHIMVSFIDITDRGHEENAESVENAETEEAKAESKQEKSWDDLLNALDDVVIIVDREFHIEDINDSAIMILEKSKEELIGKSYHEVIHETDGPEEDCPLKKTLDIEIPQIANCELFGLPFIIRVSPIIDENGDLVKMAVILKDGSKITSLEGKIKGYEEKFVTLSEKIQNWVEKLDNLLGTD